MAIETEDIVFTIHRTHNILKRYEDKVFAECELSTEQYEVLLSINLLNTPVRPSDIALRLTRSVNSISMIIDRMVKAGLLRRTRSIGDRREVYVSITDEVERRLRLALAAEFKLVHRVTSQLSNEDKQELRNILSKIQHEAEEALRHLQLGLA